MDDLDDSIAASPAAPFFRPVLTVTAEEVAACGEDVTSRGVPVLVKGGINSWPCAGKWSFEYIADNVGCALVAASVQARVQGRTEGPHLFGVDAARTAFEQYALLLTQTTPTQRRDCGLVRWRARRAGRHKSTTDAARRSIFATLGIRLCLRFSFFPAATCSDVYGCSRLLA
jgi:hypothetical protein